VYAKALCLLLKAFGGSEKSRLDIEGVSEKSRFATAGTRNDVPLPSHTLVVALATDRLFAISKGMWAVKLCTNKILRWFLTGGAG